ncbi:hypothetical protein MMC13_006799 [Lambiella insularis]|nr:hypothetical protein [Lambiella insularis]
MDQQSLSSNEAQRRRMAIDSVLNPADSSLAVRHQPSRESSVDGHSQSSSSPDSTGDYRHINQDHSGYTMHNSRHTSRSSSGRRERREMRPTYQQEEEYFIWYHRVDLNLDWRDVRAAYNNQFPDRQRRGFQGIQCKYYRCCETHGIPRVRERNRAATPDKSYGVRTRLPGLWYPWMRPQHRGAVSPRGIPPQSPEHILSRTLIALQNNCSWRKIEKRLGSASHARGLSEDYIAAAEERPVVTWPRLCFIPLLVMSLNTLELADF